MTRLESLIPEGMQLLGSLSWNHHNYFSVQNPDTQSICLFSAGPNAGHQPKPNLRSRYRGVKKGGIMLNHPWLAWESLLVELISAEADDRLTTYLERLKAHQRLGFVLEIPEDGVTDRDERWLEQIDPDLAYAFVKLKGAREGDEGNACLVAHPHTLSHYFARDELFFIFYYLKSELSPLISSVLEVDEEFLDLCLGYSVPELMIYLMESMKEDPPTVELLEHHSHWRLAPPSLTLRTQPQLWMKSTLLSLIEGTPIELIVGMLERRLNG